MPSVNNELTLREIEVLSWIARGWSCRRAAHELWVSENTVTNLGMRWASFTIRVRALSCTRPKPPSEGHKVWI